MRKIALLPLLIVPILFFTSCSDDKKGTNTNNSSFSSSSSGTSSTYTPLILNDKTLSYSPFSINGTSLIFPNKEDNNKISIIQEPYPKTLISTSNVVDFMNYSTETLVVIDNIIYFADGASNNSLSSISLSDKIYNKINTNNVHKLISYNKSLFYINGNDNKLYTYNTESKKGSLISSDKVGEYIINGDFILYQNLSDNSNLYSIKLDGSQRTKISDFSVDSFVPYESNILTINSSDNNNLYIINPSNLESKRLALMKGEKLKIHENNLYFLNLDDRRALYSLSVDIDNSKTTSKLIVNDTINDYFPVDNGIFLEKSINVNNTYISQPAN